MPGTADHDPAAMTLLLRRAAGNDAEAWEAVYPWIMKHLRPRAHRQRVAANAPGVATTALVYDAAADILRYLEKDVGRWEGLDREQFLRLTTCAMCRDILTERRRENRRRQAERRHDEARRDDARSARAKEAIDEALDELARRDHEAAAILQLAYVGDDAGRRWTAAEIAESLALAPRTLDRRKAEAKAWVERWVRDHYPDLGGPVPAPE